VCADSVVSARSISKSEATLRHVRLSAMLHIQSRKSVTIAASAWAESTKDASVSRRDFKLSMPESEQWQFRAYKAWIDKAGTYPRPTMCNNYQQWLFKPAPNSPTGSDRSLSGSPRKKASPTPRPAARGGVGSLDVGDVGMAAVRGMRNADLSISVDSPVSDPGGGAITSTPLPSPMNKGPFYVPPTAPPKSPPLISSPLGHQNATPPMRMGGGVGGTLLTQGVFSRAQVFETGRAQAAGPGVVTVGGGGFSRSWSESKVPTVQASESPTLQPSRAGAVW